VTSLNLWWDQGNGNWQSLVGNNPYVLDSTYTLTGVTAGSTYNFKYRASNIYGFGPFSSISSIVAASLPDKPSNVITTINGLNVRVGWSMPFSQGSPITQFTVQIKQKDGTFSTDSGCSTATVVTNSYCDITLLSIQASPYLLIQDDVIVAQVSSTNSLGTSAYQSSSTTSGARVEIVPLKPTIQASRGSLTSQSQLEIVISPLTGADNGGSLILSYAIYVNGTQVTNSFNGIRYIHTATSGAEYSVQYAGINRQGVGILSDAFTISAISIPSAPLSPTVVYQSVG
jgi:hypothetical protein